MLSEKEIEKNEAAINTLLPEVQQLARKHLAFCSQKGIDLLIVQALRTKEEQDKLYAEGRTAPGPKASPSRPMGEIVTNAKFGFSWHCFGRAYDVAIVENGNINWYSPKYATAGYLGQSLGLVWGGSFKAIHGDLGHFEFHPGLTLADAREKAGIATA